MRGDPYERADVTSNTYWDCIFDHAFVYVPVEAAVGFNLNNPHEAIPVLSECSLLKKQYP